MILQVRGLKKYYDPRNRAPDEAGKLPRVVKAVDGVTLGIRRGETLGLVGESGCGKTTLARCILRLTEPTAGQVVFRGRDLLKLSGSELRRERRFIQAIFQDPYASLNPGMRVGEILEEPLRIHRLGRSRERRQKVAELLQMAGLEPSAADRFPSQFSGGQRQRVSVARAISLDPELIVADEPVSALDVSVQGQIVNLLQDLRERLGLTVLFISHSLPLVSCICDRVAVMYRGRIVETAKTSAVFHRPLHPYTQALLAAVPEPDPQRGFSAPPPPDGEYPLGKLEMAEEGHWVAGPDAG